MTRPPSETSVVYRLLCHRLLSPWGFALFVLGLAMNLLPLSELKDAGWMPRSQALPLAGSALTMVGFVMLMARLHVRSLDLRWLTEREARDQQKRQAESSLRKAHARALVTALDELRRTAVRRPLTATERLRGEAALAPGADLLKALDAAIETWSQLEASEDAFWTAERKEIEELKRNWGR